MYCTEVYSLCLLCRAEVPEVGSANRRNPKYAAWEESCAVSLRGLFELDESFHDFLSVAVYCSPCQSLVRDIDFTLSSISLLQARLEKARTKVDCYLRENVRQSSSIPAPSPGSEPKYDAYHHFIKSLGKVLSFAPEDTEPEPIVLNLPSAPARRRKQLLVPTPSSPVNEECSVTQTPLVLPPLTLSLIPIDISNLNFNLIAGSNEIAELPTRTIGTRFREILPRPSPFAPPEPEDEDEQEEDRSDLHNDDKEGDNDPDFVPNGIEVLEVVSEMNRDTDESRSDWLQKKKLRKGRERLVCFYKNCRYETLNPNRLPIHVREVHKSDPNPYHYCSCGRGYRLSELLRRHKKRCTGTGSCSPTDKIASCVAASHDTAGSTVKHKCTYEDCGFRTTQVARLSAHVNLAHEVDPKTPWHCKTPGCGKRFATRHYLTKHVQDQNCLLAEVLKTTTERTEAEPERRIRVKARLRNEKDYMSRLKLKCTQPDCRYVTYNQMRFEAHVRAVHEASQLPYHCSVCEGKFASPKDLTRHKGRDCLVTVVTVFKSHAGEKKLKCDAYGCKAVFSTNQGLERHKNKSGKHPAAQPEPIKCDLCSKTFLKTQAGTEELDRHVQLHRLRAAESVERTFSCVMTGCSKVHTTSFDLRVHVVNEHEDNQDRKCDLCGLLMASTNSMKRHMRDIHAPKREHLKCPHPGCPYYGKSSGDLKNHSNRHSLEKKFTCEICGDQFTWQSSYRIHMRAHADVREHKCNYADCEKAFSKAAHLRAHEETHSTVLSYLCTLCPKAFKTCKSLGQHIRFSHKQKEERDRQRILKREAKALGVDPPQIPKKQKRRKNRWNYLDDESDSTPTPAQDPVSVPIQTGENIGMNSGERSNAEQILGTTSFPGPQYRYNYAPLNLLP